MLPMLRTRYFHLVIDWTEGNASFVRNKCTATQWVFPPANQDTVQSDGTLFHLYRYPTQLLCYSKFPAGTL